MLILLLSFFAMTPNGYPSGIMPSIMIILFLKGKKLVNFDALQCPQARALSALGPLISGMPQP
jgi:hypothetical protein